MQTLMAHHLIALLFSSAQYTTSPCMKPTRPVHHRHTPEIVFSHISLCLALLSSLPVQLSLSFHFFQSPSFLIRYSCPLLFIPLYLCFYPHPCVYVSLLLLWTPPPPLHLPSVTGSLFSADVPLVSGGLAGRQQKWLWDWGMAALLSLTHRATLMSLQLHIYRVDRGVGEWGGGGV